MVETASQMIPLGTIAPEFSLPDTVSGNSISLQAIKGEIATVIMFICNHCPFVKHIQDQLTLLGQDFHGEQISMAAISSNDVEHYPDDSPDKMKQLAVSQGYVFPYLYDESQEVAKAYQAACTPEFYIFDKGLKCVYRGQLDDSRPGNDIPVTGQNIRSALEAMLKNQPVNPDQKPSMGCNIKWKSE